MVGVGIEHCHSMDREELRGLLSQLTTESREGEITTLLGERPGIVSEPWFAEVVTGQLGFRIVARFQEMLASLTPGDLDGRTAEQLLSYAASPVVSPAVVATILRTHSENKELRRACVGNLEFRGDNIAPSTGCAQALACAMITEDDPRWRLRVESLHRYHRAQMR